MTNPPAPIAIRLLTSTDIAGVARVHRSAFPTSGVALLGQRITERYYAWQLEHSRRPAILGVDGPDGLVGFLFAGETFGSMSSFIRSSPGSVLAALLVRPWVIWQVRRQIVSELAAHLRARRRSVQQSPAPGRARRTTWLHSLGVLTDQQRRGIGLRLMQAAVDWVREQGYEEVYLAVRLNNTRAIRLYEGLGWTRVDDLNWRGRMYKSLTVPAASTGASTLAMSVQQEAASSPR